MDGHINTINNNVNVPSIKTIANATSTIKTIANTMPYFPSLYCPHHVCVVEGLSLWTVFDVLLWASGMVLLLLQYLLLFDAHFAILAGMRSSQLLCCCLSCMSRLPLPLPLLLLLLWCSGCTWREGRHGDKYVDRGRVKGVDDANELMLGCHHFHCYCHCHCRIAFRM